MKRPPRLYFSFRSPYSWLAIVKLRRTLPDLFDRVTPIPYWDPDPALRQALDERGAELPYQPMSRAKHRYVLLDTKRMANQLGCEMTWPVDVDPWWELPHLGWLAARRTGDGQACYDVLTTARWGRGADICDNRVFEHTLTEAGLDGAALRLAAEHDDDLRAEGLACLVSAYEDDVFGVPYLLMGHRRYWGLDRVDHFLAEYAANGGSSPEPVPVGLPVYDTDTAGGCG